MTKFGVLKKQYQATVDHLDEILKIEKDDIVRDAAIKRFELTFDRSWKMIKACLEEKKGLSCICPKGCLREAYHQGLIDYGKFWLKMVDWHNKLISVYSICNEQFLNSLYKKLPKMLKLFQLLRKNIEEY